ncbi:hypothetical protein MMC08_009150 [Hypocenomyce scalaris]|nr:hypothetical protein [Hypocenomyce scalaris]
MEELGTVLNGSQRLYHFPALRIKRHIVRQELLRAAQAAGVDIHFGRKCIGIVNEDNASIAVKFAMSRDAAHAIPPTGGQGAAMAFEDAETLAYTIS